MMIYLHTYKVMHGYVHDFYNTNDEEFYSVSETMNINFYVITTNGSHSTIPFKYALPKNYYCVTYNNNRYDDLENSKLRIALNNL